MPKKRTKKDEQAAVEKLARSAVEEKAKPSRKNLPKPKKAKPEAPVSGKLTAREKERSLWAPRVSPKAPKKKK
jgi:hypothetical protein